MQYLHGVKTYTYITGPRPVYEIPSAVIALVGTAPNSLVPPGQVVLFTGEEYAWDKLGTPQDGYTVWDALKAIYAQQNTLVYFINAFNETTHINSSGKPDPSLVSSNDVINAIDVFDSIYAEGFRYTPKIFIAPEFSHDPGVANKLASKAAKFRGIAIADIPEEINIDNLLTYKELNGLNSDRLVLTYPKVRRLDNTTYWLSPYLAGLIAWVDANSPQMYGDSPSNYEIKEILGASKKLTYIPNDENSDIQRINAQGVYTLLTYLGQLKGFGNNTAAYPLETHPAKRFINWVRVSGLIEEILENTLLQFLDRPTFFHPEAPLEPTIKTVENTINDFLRTLLNKGVLIYKSVKVDRERTTLNELLSGRIHYILEPIPAPPLEGIVLHKTLNSERVAEVFQKLFS